MLNLKGKTAVVTGGTRGIGKETALQLAENGANIALIYIGNEDDAKPVQLQLQEFGVRAEIYNCDVSDWEESKTACETIIKDFGQVDIVVNNAGIIKDGLILRMKEEDFDAVIDVNLKGAFNIIRHLSRSVMKSSAGRIINISSVIGLMGNAGQANYSASKAGLLGLTKSVAREFAAKAVTCNAIAPGYIETDMTAGLPPEAKERLNASVPLKRAGTAKDVASLVVFLASGAAEYITGEVIKVDGGLYI